MMILNDLARKYAKSIGKDWNEVRNVRVTSYPSKLNDKIAFGLELIIVTPHVRYVRVGKAFVADKIRFISMPSKTRLTVKFGNTPTKASFFDIDGNGPYSVFHVSSTPSTGGKFTWARTSDYEHEGIFLADDYVEATCYFTITGLHLGGVLVATAKELKELGHDAVNLSNGCKFDTWELGMEIWREKSMLHILELSPTEVPLGMRMWCTLHDRSILCRHVNAGELRTVGVYNENLIRGTYEGIGFMFSVLGTVCVPVCIHTGVQAGLYVSGQMIASAAELARSGYPPDVLAGMDGEELLSIASQMWDA